MSAFRYTIAVVFNQVFGIVSDYVVAAAVSDRKS